jgi:hypothetical protein
MARVCINADVSTFDRMSIQREVWDMKKNVNPFVALFIILAVLGVAGTILYRLSEPPLVNVPKKSEEQMLKEGQQMMQGFKEGIRSMAQQVKENDAKKAAAGKKSGAKSEAPAKEK